MEAQGHSQCLLSRPEDRTALTPGKYSDSRTSWLARQSELTGLLFSLVSVNEMENS